MYKDSKDFEMKVEEAVSIAKELYFRRIESNSGNYLANTMEQMTKHGIPLFTSRYKLQRRTQEYLDSGHFLKEIMGLVLISAI